MVKISRTRRGLRYVFGGHASGVKRVRYSKCKEEPLCIEELALNYYLKLYSTVQYDAVGASPPQACPDTVATAPSLLIKGPTRILAPPIEEVQRVIYQEPRIRILGSIYRAD